jgi:hypothetical protein
MKILNTLFLFLAFAFSTQAQFPAHVKVLDVKLNETKTITGSLSEGRYVDLRFGMRASVGCFTEDQKIYFNGHHCLYAFKVPANTKVLVELHTKGDESLYGYLIDAKRYDVPPYLENVGKTGCSSSFKEEGEMDRVMLKAGDTEMNVVIGVAGVNEANNGAFALKITAKP